MCFEIYVQEIYKTNLFLDLEQNLLSDDEMEMIWKPNVGYTNAKIGTIQREHLGVMVRRESEPIEFDFSSAREGIESIWFIVFQLFRNFTLGSYVSTNNIN